MSHLSRLYTVSIEFLYNVLRIIAQLSGYVNLVSIFSGKNISNARAYL